MHKIEFDEQTKASVTELSKTINELQVRLQLICQTVAYMNGEDPAEYILASDLSGIIKLEKRKSNADET